MRKGISGFFKGDEVIELHVDQDCLLYMMKLAYDWSWPNHPVRKKRQLVVASEPAQLSG
jgi:hypothetical protein